MDTEVTSQIDGDTTQIESANLKETEENTQTPDLDPDRYYKVIQENKSYRAKARSIAEENAKLRAEIEQVEADKLRSQGKYKDLFEKERSQRESLEKALKEKHQTYAYNVVNSQVGRALEAAGCVDVDAALKLAPIGDLEVDENFVVDGNTVSSMIEGLQREKNYLFRKATPSVKDAVPGTPKNGFRPEPKKLENMSMEELFQMAKRMDGKT